MSGRVTSVGRICYVEPNAFDDQSNLYYRSSTQLTESGEAKKVPSGPANTQLMHDYEDYQVAVDLLIETRSKYDFQDAMNENNPSFGRTFAHFIGGNYDQDKTTWYLTTDYSDYSERTLLKGMNHESIGITNISISYESNYRPSVTIDFVDVRGASFMLPEEGSYVRQLNYEKTHGYTGMVTDMKKGSFFSSLLSFPPPNFYLRVKGIYGGTVTFKLTMAKYEISFDDSNGNFNIKTTFIGQQYAMLSDIPFSMLYAAQKSSSGRLINTNNAYTFSGRNEGILVPTIEEYCRQVEDVTKENKKFYDEEEKEALINKLSMETLAFTYLLGLFPTTGENWEYSVASECYYGCFNLTTIGNSNNTYESFSNNAAVFSCRVDLLIEEDIAVPEYIKRYTEKINSILDINNERESADYHIKVGKNSEGNSVVREIFKGNMSDIEHILTYSPVSSKIFDNSSDGDEIIIFKVDSGIECSEKLSEHTEGIGNKLDELRKREATTELLFVENIMGYVPSIRNINQIIFSALQTFMDMFFNYLNEIWNDTKSNKRKYKTFVKSPEECDVNGAESTDLPPFPLFMKTINTKKGPKRQMMWPPNYDTRLIEMREVKFVYELLSAVEANGINGNRLMYRLKNELEGQNKHISTTNCSLKMPSGVIHDYIPLSPCDFIIDSKNPYEFIARDVPYTEYGKWIYSTFMCRDTYVEQTLDFKYLSGCDKVDDLANTVGVIEAYNAYFALSDKFTYNELFPDDNNIEAFRFDSNGDDNFFEDETYNWVKTNDGNTFLPIICSDWIGNAFSEDSIYKYKQTSERSDVKNCYIKYGDFNTRSACVSYYDLEDVFAAATKSFGIIKNNQLPISINSLFGFSDANSRCVYTSESYKSGFENRNTIRRLYDRNSSAVISPNFSLVKHLTSDGKYNKMYSAPIFLTSWYYEQETIEAKAYLFVMSLRTNGNNGFMDGKMNNVSRTQLDIISEGAYYWRKNVIKETGVDPINIPAQAKTIKRVFDGYNEGFLVISSRSDETEEDKKYNTAREELRPAFLSFANSESFSKINNCLSLKKDDNTLFTKDDFKDVDTTSFSRFNRFYKILGQDGNSEDNTKKLQFASEIDGIYYAWHIDFNYDEEGFDELNDVIDELLCNVKYFYDINYDINGNLIENKPLMSDGHEDFRYKAWDAFKTTLKLLYGVDETKDNGADDRIEDQNGDSNPDSDETKSDDIRLNTYLTLKSLYEKWICASRRSEWCITDKNCKNPKFKFEYLDSYHKDIGDEVMVTIEEVSKQFKNFTGVGSDRLDNHSINTLIGNIAQKVGCMYFALPFMFGQTRNPAEICDLFDTKPVRNIGFEDQSTFVMMYAYKPSSQLSTGKSNETKDDGFDLADTLGNMSPILPSDLMQDSADNMSKEIKQIPAFGVSYGRQNQSYFKKISLSTNSPNGNATAYSIETLVNIAKASSESQVKNNIYGQDAYRIFSNYAYMCQVTMLGNAMISPLMLFQLNNIPMWKGAYQITQVKHTITPGNMDTVFSGYRLCKYSNAIIEPLPISSALLGKDLGLGPGDSGDGNSNGGGNNGNNEGGRRNESEGTRGSTTPENAEEQEAPTPNPSFEDRHKIARGVLFREMHDYTPDSQDEMPSQPYGHIYSFVVATLMDNCTTESEMKAKLDELMQENNRTLEPILKLRSNYTAQLEQPSDAGLNIRFNRNDGDGRLEGNPMEMAENMVNPVGGGIRLDKRRIVTNYTNLSVTEVMEILSNHNNFKSGDIVMYGVNNVDVANSARNPYGDYTPIIKVGAEYVIPHFTQVYYGTEGVVWYSAEKKLEHDFYYVNTPLFSGVGTIPQSKGNYWYLQIIRYNN